MESVNNSAEVLSLASEAGHILLENGAEIERVEETMERIASHYGEDKENFFVLSNGIFTTGKSYANVEFIPIKGSRLDKVVAINQFSRDISEGKFNLGQARARLEEIKAAPGKPLWEQIAGAALGSGTFCAIFGGSLVDCAAATLAGTLVFLMSSLFTAKNWSKALSNVCSGALGTAACIVFQALGFGETLGNMMIGTLIPLIPGVPFTNGLRDISNEDYIAGITRLLDALMVFLCIAIGVCVTFAADRLITGSMIEMHGTVTDPLTALFPIQMAAAFLGTVAFSVLFGVPREHYLSCGLVGMLGWMAYLLILRHSPLGVVGATLVASTLIALMSSAAARLRKCPSMVFLICGAFPLIPGAGVFWTSYYIVSEQMRSALGSGFLAFEVTIAIVFGIIISGSLKRRKKCHQSGN